MEDAGDSEAAGGQRRHGLHEPALHQWGQQAGKPQQKRGKVYAVSEAEKKKRLTFSHLLIIIYSKVNYFVFSW